MSDFKSSTIRYIGYRTLEDGGRGFDFACAIGAAHPTVITIAAQSALFQGPDRIALQEATAICYETLKCRLQTEPTCTPDRFDLTSSDVAQHRKITKGSGRRY
jgi:hypothetical protein